MFTLRRVELEDELEQLRCAVIIWDCMMRSAAVLVCNNCCCCGSSSSGDELVVVNAPISFGLKLPPVFFNNLIFRSYTRLALLFVPFFAPVWLFPDRLHMKTMNRTNTSTNKLERPTMTNQIMFISTRCWTDVDLMLGLPDEWVSMNETTGGDLFPTPSDCSLACISAGVNILPPPSPLTFHFIW